MSLSKRAILEIHDLSAEAEGLVKGSQSDRARATVLLQRISTIKETGLSSDECREQYVEALAESTRLKLGDYRKAFFRYLMNGEKAELRDLLAGTQSITYTQGAAGGFTVPVEYEKQVFEALAQTDPLLSDKVCDFVMEPAPALQPKIIDGWDLSTIAASQVNEAAQQTAGSVPAVAGRVLRGNIIYKLSLAASVEAEQDEPDVMGKFARAYGVGFARKLGADAVNGNGTTQPQGLLTAVPSSGVILGTGAGTGLGPGHITSQEINAVYFSVDRIYRAQPRCGWLMSDSVYQGIRNATDNMQRPLLSVKDDKEQLMGKPVYVCPSLPFWGGSPHSASTLVFGDLGHFHIRVSKPTMQRVLSSSTADITKGECLYVGRVRMDSALFDPSNGAKPPLVTAVVQ